MSKLNQKVREDLKKLRIVNEITQNTVLTDTGFHIARYETGHHVLKLNKLEMLANFYEYDVIIDFVPRKQKHG